MSVVAGIEPAAKPLTKLEQADYERRSRRWACMRAKGDDMRKVMDYNRRIDALAKAGAK
jgi:hypothetical protein